MRTLNSELSSLLDRGLHEELINDIIECQLDQWPMAADNYHRLSHSERKPLPLKAIRGSAQWNPARIVSTGAQTDAKYIAERKCFLCSENRPEEQFSIPWLGDWELLVNPFPILPVHFTIASLSHRPQGKLPLEMAAMAEQAPDLVIFYNGARSGASAPDHQHAQAVLSSELPLMRTVEAFHPLEEQRILGSNELGGEFPFLFYSAVVPPGPEGM